MRSRSLSYIVTLAVMIVVVLLIRGSALGQTAPSVARTSAGKPAAPVKTWTPPKSRACALKSTHSYTFWPCKHG